MIVLKNTKIGKKILIIDNNTDDYSKIKTALEKQELGDILYSSTGSQGMKLAKLHRPDIVLLNAALTDMEGFEVCKKIKSIKGLEIKVILLINKGDVVNNLRAKMSGIDDYAVKAEGYEDLIRIIKTKLSRISSVNGIRDNIIV